jgi:hypothetical protein
MIIFSSEFIAESKNPNKQPDTMITITLTSPSAKTVKWGVHKHADVNACLESSVSFQTKIDPAKSLATKGNMSFDIKGSTNFNPIISGYRIKNARVDVEEGYLGIARNKYVTIYTGVISDFNINGEVLTLNVADELELLRKKYPATNSTGTQYHDYSNTNPVDIMINLIATQAGVIKYDSTQFTTERDDWYNNWKFQRLITESQDITKYLEELQEDLTGAIFHNGENIFFKAFAPLLPGAIAKNLSDGDNLIKNKTKISSGYKTAFFNRIEFYYDYDESGDNNKEINYENRYVVEDTNSQTNWDEISIKVIKSKWIKTHTFTQPSNITGLILYHISASNGTSAGKTGHTISYNDTNNTLTWSAPDGTTGDTVIVEEDGKYTLYDADPNKFIRVIVTIGSLPGSNQTDDITITALSGGLYAQIIADRLLKRFANPLPTISGEIDIKDMHRNGELAYPMQIVNLTTAKVSLFGKNGLTDEPCFFLSVKPNFKTMTASFTAAQTRLDKRYGFICPNGYPDYATATEFQRQHCYIGRTSDNKVYDGSGYVDGYYII